MLRPSPSHEGVFALAVGGEAAARAAFDVIDPDVRLSVGHSEAATRLPSGEIRRWVSERRSPRRDKFFPPVDPREVEGPRHARRQHDQGPVRRYAWRAHSRRDQKWFARRLQVRQRERQRPHAGVGGRALKRGGRSANRPASSTRLSGSLQQVPRLPARPDRDRVVALPSPTGGRRTRRPCRRASARGMEVQLFFGSGFSTFDRVAALRGYLEEPGVAVAVHDRAVGQPGAAGVVVPEARRGARRWPTASPPRPAPSRACPSRRRRSCRLSGDQNGLMAPSVFRSSASQTVQVAHEQAGRARRSPAGVRRARSPPKRPRRHADLEADRPRGGAAAANTKQSAGDQPRGARREHRGSPRPRPAAASAQRQARPERPVRCRSRPGPRERCARRRCRAAGASGRARGSGAETPRTPAGVAPGARAQSISARSTAASVSETVSPSNGCVRSASRRARRRTPRCRRACRPACRAPARGTCTPPSRG